MRNIVLPGEKISEKKIYSPSTYVEGETTYAATLGMVDEEGRYIPLEQCYKPAPGDIVVGFVSDSRHSGYNIDLNLSYPGFLSSRETRIHMKLGEMVSGRVREVDEVGTVDLSEIRKLPKGTVLSFPAAKIPRLIGKKSSMLNMIKEATQTDIIVGNNGYIWIAESENLPKILKTISIVLRRAHLSGLTDEISKFLKGE